jgi:hypothetical protein
MVLLLLLACVAGPPGPRGESGPPGEAGPEGEAGPRGLLVFSPPLYGWADATGTLVLPTERLEVFDEQGLLWQVNPETATLVGIPTPTLYESDDCTGEPLVASQDLPPPRVAISTTDGLAWVRHDDTPAETASVRVGSTEVRGESVMECQDAWTGARRAVVRQDALLRVVAPWFGWAGPLHPAATTPE